jgi:hypothetical protein
MANDFKAGCAPAQCVPPRCLLPRWKPFPFSRDDLTISSGWCQGRCRRCGCRRRCCRCHHQNQTKPQYVCQAGWVSALAAWSRPPILFIPSSSSSSSSLHPLVPLCLEKPPPSEPRHVLIIISRLLVSLPLPRKPRSTAARVSYTSASKCGCVGSPPVSMQVDESSACVRASVRACFCG